MIINSLVTNYTNNTLEVISVSFDGPVVNTDYESG